MKVADRGSQNVNLYFERITVMPKTDGSAPEAPTPAMLTLSQAAEYAGVSKTKLKSAMGNARFAAIFGSESGNVKITHFHPEVPDLIEIAPAALDAWKIEREKPAAGRRNVGPDKPRRYEVKFAANQLEAVTAALAPLGIEAPYVAYKSRAGKKRGAGASNEPEANAVGVNPEAPATPREAAPVKIEEISDLVSA